MFVQLDSAAHAEVSTGECPRAGRSPFGAQSRRAYDLIGRFATLLTARDRARSKTRYPRRLSPGSGHRGSERLLHHRLRRRAGPCARRPAAARASPLRDVAGMIRSRSTTRPSPTARRQHGGEPARCRAEDLGAARMRNVASSRSVAWIFVAAYRKAIGEGLLRSWIRRCKRRRRREMINFSTRSVEKAVLRSVDYEARVTGPIGSHIPLRGILGVLALDHSGRSGAGWTDMDRRART